MSQPAEGITPVVDLTPRERKCFKCVSLFTGSKYQSRCPACLRQEMLECHQLEMEGEQRSARATLPPWQVANFADGTFRKLTARAPTVVEACQTWAPEKGSLVLSGPTGCGKTLSVLALARRILDSASAVEANYEDRRLAAGIRFLCAGDVVADRRGHPLGRGQAPLVRSAIRARLLLLDELGFEPFDEVIFTILDARYRRRLPAIVTTGLGLPGLESRYGSAAVRRLLDPGQFVSAGASRESSHGGH